MELTTTKLSWTMKTIFLDIETVPTSDALEEFRRQQSNAEPEKQVIKRLSLSALTGKILCIAYAIEPPVDTAVEVLFGEEPNVIHGFWRVAADVGRRVRLAFLLFRAGFKGIGTLFP